MTCFPGLEVNPDAGYVGNFFACIQVSNLYMATVKLVRRAYNADAPLIQFIHVHYCFPPCAGCSGGVIPACASKRCMAALISSVESVQCSGAKTVILGLS